MSYFLDFLRASDNDAKPAVHIDETTYTYKELKRAVAVIAEYIQSRGLHKQAICVYQEDRLETYAAILAVWCTGNTFIPINPTYPEARVDYISQLAEAKMIIATAGSALPYKGNIPVYHPNLAASCQSEVPTIVPYTSNDIVYILFTSGSTGVPKGVQINYENLESFLSETDRLGMDLPPGSGFLQLFDLSFDFSMIPFLWPFQQQGVLYHLSAKGVKYLEIYRMLEEYPIHFVLIVPSLLNMLKPYLEDIDLPNLKVVALGGEAVPTELTRQWQTCCPNAKFYNFYGPTECTIFCTSYEIPRGDIYEQNGIVSIGRTNAHCIALVQDATGKPVARGEKGLLWVGGKQVTPGYVANEQLNKELFMYIDGVRYYNTGDVVVENEAGYYFYLGRLDQQVKINGYRIELSEVEHVATNALQLETAVIAVKDEKDHARLILFLQTNQAIEQETVLGQLTHALPSYMLPAKVITMTEFPVNSNGKLDRKALRESWQQLQP